MKPARPGPARTALVAVVGAAGVAVLVGGWAGVLCGVAAGSVLWRVLRRLPSRVAAADPRVAAELALAADLTAAALRAGAPPDHAARTVGTALPGAVGRDLTRVANALRLGEPATDAWRHLADLPGGARFARVAARSADSGAALATALGRLADELRADRIAAAEAAAQRAGVLLVLPLGLCFLPAFLIAGVVPVVLAVFHSTFH